MEVKIEFWNSLLTLALSRFCCCCCCCEWQLMWLAVQWLQNTDKYCSSPVSYCGFFDVYSHEQCEKASVRKPVCIGCTELLNKDDLFSVWDRITRSICKAESLHQMFCFDLLSPFNRSRFSEFMTSSCRSKFEKTKTDLQLFRLRWNFLRHPQWGPADTVVMDPSA